MTGGEDVMALGLEFRPPDSGQLGKVERRQEWVFVGLGAVLSLLVRGDGARSPVAWKLILEARAESSASSRQEPGIHARVFFLERQFRRWEGSGAS